MPTEPTTVTVRVVGADDEGGAVFLSEFRQFCDGLEVCLRRTESRATGHTGRVAYKLVGLATGSASLTFEAVRRGRGRDARGRVLRLFRKTVSAIQRGKGLDPRIGPDDVSAFKKLASPLNRGSKSVFIDDTEITSQYIANADKILNTSLAQEGTVSGSLERVNVHDRYGFILFPPIEGYEISCLFPEEMLDQVRLAIKHNVTVNGLMHYYADSPFPKVVRVVSMEIHPNDDDLPTLEELRGMAPGCTGGLTAVEFTRAVRDD